MAVISTLTKVLDKKFADLECSIDADQDRLSAALACGFFQSYQIGDELAKYGEQAVPELIHYIKDSDSLDHRLAIIHALGKIASGQAVPFLVECLSSKHLLERQYASIALGQIQSPTALDGLLNALENEEYVRKDMFKALINCADKKNRQSIYHKAKQEENPDIRRMAVSMITLENEADAAEKLLETLHDKQMGVVFTAVRQLKDIGPALVPALIDKLTAKGKYTRMAATQMLGDFKDERAVLPLCHQLLTSNNKALRTQIAFTLGKIKSETAVDTLCRALQDKDDEVRTSAAEALSKIKSPLSETALIRHLEAQNIRFSCRSTPIIAEVLGKLKTPGANEALIQALFHQNDEVRMTAAKVLLKNKVTDAIGPMGKALEKETSRDGKDMRELLESSIFKLNEIKAKQEAAQLKKTAKKGPVKKEKQTVEKDDITHNLTALSDQDPGERLKGISFFKKLNDNSYVKAVEPLLYDADQQVRISAALAIAALGPRETVTRLSEAIQTENKITLPYAIEALGLLEDELAIEALLPFTEDTEGHIVKKTKTALNRLKCPDERINEFHIRHELDCFMKRPDAGRIAKLGDVIRAPLEKALTDFDHSRNDFRDQTAKALKAIGWEPVTPEQKVVFHTYCGPFESLDLSSPVILKTLIRELQSRHTDSIARKIAAALLKQEKGIDEVFSELGHENGRQIAIEIIPYGQRYFDRLIHILGHDSDLAKSNAAHILGRIGIIQAVPELINALQSAIRDGISENVPAQEICLALGKLKDKRAIPVLCQALTLKPKWITDAVNSLGNIGSLEGGFALFALLKTKPIGYLATRLNVVLKHIGWEPKDKKDRAYLFLHTRQYDKLISEKLEAYIIEDAMELIHSSDYFDEPLISILLDHGEHERLIDPVLLRLGYASAGTCQLAMKTIKRIGKKTVPHLLDTARTGQGNKRTNAIVLLGYFKDPSSLEPIIAMLNENDETLFKPAADTLGNLKDERAVKPLLNILNIDSVPVQRAVINALGKIGSAEAISPLERFKPRDPGIETLTKDTLAKLKRFSSP